MLTYELASWPDEFDLVAEMARDGAIFAVLRKRADGVELTVYPDAEWSVPLADFLDLVHAATEQLTAG